MDASPCSLRAIAAALLLATALPLASTAAEPALPFHVTALMELTVDGQPADSARAEGAFGEALATAGLHRITAAAAGIGSVADAEKGAGHPAADLAIIARIESRKLGAIRGTSMVRYEASANAQVLATETGEVLGTLTAEGPGIDLDGASAARIAAAHAARTLAERLAETLPALAAAPRTVEITITGLPDQAEADHAAQVLAGAAAVEAVSVVSREGRGRRSKTRVRATVRGLSAADLARFIGETRGLGLRVEGHTLRRIRAVFDPALRFRLAVKVARLVNRTGEAAEDAMLGPLTRVLRTALGAADGVALDDDGAPFAVHGSLSYVGRSEVAIALELKGPSGAVVARSRVVGPGQRFSRTVRKAARALGIAGLAKVRRDAGLRRIAGLPLKLPAAPEPPPAAIVAVDVRPAVVGEPLVVRVTLAHAPEGGRLAVRTGQTGWTERSQARSADGLTRVFEGPKPAASGAVDVVTTLHARRGGRWQTERVMATAVVRPELVARWSGDD